MTYVDNDAALRRVCAQLAVAPRFALDTEFVGERTYVPALELIQVATADEVALIDCRAVSSLEPFFAVLAAMGVEKVLHAGQQDLDLFHSLTGAAPAPILDTQVAAALGGYGAQVGYAQLVERLLGVTVDKSETLTDWSRRPLTKAQLAYAVDDVRYLLPACDALKARLAELGRWEWAVEECRRLERSVRSIPMEPEDAWLRVRGRGSLRARGLVVLRALAEWREEIARTRNKPRASIVRDEALVEIARKAPTSVEGLRGLRAVHSRDLERHAGDVVARISAALETPKDAWPQPPPPPTAAPSTGVVELLQAVLRLRAEDAGIAPTLLATNADLQLLVQRHAAGAAAELPIMQGWRHTIAGGALLALLEGRASVSLDPATGAVRVSKRRSGEP
ncbi:MAG TPA: ribonuclease D [Candidatus Dormibacteraeota bacterium]|nr:ribonuclease D [Candidatus Dormibacteraeota bacterium]